MCGYHGPDGSPIDHVHDHPKPVFYPRLGLRSRRAFLGDVGGGAVAMAVFTPALLAACSSDGAGTDAAATASATTAPDPTATTAAPDPTATPAPAESSAAAPTTAPDVDDASTEPAESNSGELVWARANLGFVSAYVLARGNTAAIVDTGVAGSAAAIGETLSGLGLTYNDVAHVILTHNHGDHAGSISEVLAAAVNATAYAGEADLGPLPQEIVGTVGGEDIFGFEMVATPGHTPGHMVVIDHAAGLLVAGDAIFTDGGGVVEGPERFFNDVPRSRESIKAMAELSFNTLLVGHGDPITNGADTAVAALAGSF